jgi:hypothetical protein
MESLDRAMADLMECKNSMNDVGMNKRGDTLGSMDNEGLRKGLDNGLGRGRGQGDRPETRDEAATYSTKVQQQIRKGKAVLQGFTHPTMTIKGQSTIDIQGEMAAATAADADALSNQRIPKNVEKHIRAYYHQINNGK